MSSLLTILAFSPLPPFIFALIIGLPSALLYATQLVIIWIWPKNVAFQSSFFQLVAIRTLWSLFGLIAGFLHERFGRVGLFLPVYLQLPQIFLAFVYSVNTYSLHVDNLATMVLMFNRLTALLYPIKYKKFWRHAIYWSIGLILLLPLPFTWQIFTLDLFVHIQTDGTFTIDYHGRIDGSQDNTALYGMYSCAIFTVACLCLNLACFFAYRKHKKQRKDGSRAQEDDDKIELKLALYTIITFLAQIFMTIVAILMYLTQYIISDPELNELLFLSIYNQFSWIGDLCKIVVPAWLLLWASDSMRKRFTEILQKFSRNLTTSSLSQQQQQGGVEQQRSPEGRTIAWGQ